MPDDNLIAGATLHFPYRNGNMHKEAARDRVCVNRTGSMPDQAAPTDGSPSGVSCGF